MDPTRPTAPRPAPGLLQRLFPPVVAARDVHRNRALAFGAIAVVIVLVGVFAAPDAVGLVFSLVFGGWFAARAGVHLWQLRRTGPREQIATSVDGLPVAERPAALRRALWIGGAATLALSIWNGWSLWSVETGRVAEAEVWGPIALVYEHLGFWPAMLVLPSLFALIVVSGTRKLRRVEAEAARPLTPPPRTAGS